MIVHRSDRLRPIVEADPALFDQHARDRTPSDCSIASASRVTDIVTHSMGGMVASRFASLYPDAVGNLAMINQIGLTDARSAGRGATRHEVYKASLARDYAEIVRGMRAYYVNWKPEYMKYVKIHYGWTKSGDWPRMAMVRALQQQAIDADPVVYDWPQHQGAHARHRRRERRSELSRQRQTRRRHACRTGSSTSSRTSATTRSSRRHSCCIRRCCKFLKGEDVGTFKGTR